MFDDNRASFVGSESAIGVLFFHNRHMAYPTPRSAITPIEQTPMRTSGTTAAFMERMDPIPIGDGSVA